MSIYFLDLYAIPYAPMEKKALEVFNIFVLFLQPIPPPSPLMRRVRPMSDRLPSPLGPASSGSSLSPMRGTVAKASKFHTLPMTVSQVQHSSWTSNLNQVTINLENDNCFNR